MSSTQLDLSTASGVGPFDLTGLGLIPNNRIPWVAQIDVYQNDAIIDSTNYTIDSSLGTITFNSDINDQFTLIRRDTPAELAVYFIDGARVPAADLNDAFGQLANKVDELRTDPVADLDLNDLADVGAVGDNPTTDDIMVYDGAKWAFENRGAANSVTAENVLVEFNGSDAETTLQNHDIDIDALQEQTADISVVGDLTKVDGDFRVTGDAFLDGAVSFGSLVGDLDLNGTFTTNSVDINTTNGATAISISNTGSGQSSGREFTIDLANSSRTSFRNNAGTGFDFLTDSSKVALQIQGDHDTVIYKEGDTNDYVWFSPRLIGTSSTVIGVYDNTDRVASMTGNGRIIKTGAQGSSIDVLNRTENDDRYRPPSNYVSETNGGNIGSVWTPYTSAQVYTGNGTGHIRAGSVSNVSSQLDGRTDIYNFTAIVFYKDTFNGILVEEWRSGTATGDEIATYVEDMRNGRTYSSSLGTSARYNLNLDYVRVYQR